jgi:hypothetical protein
MPALIRWMRFGSERGGGAVARLLVGMLAALLVMPGSAMACGGFFCTTIPVDQNAEQIIFAMDEGKITTYVQINYTGSPDNFAWVLPVPSVPTLAQADMQTFRELNRLTTPLFLPPRAPDCLLRRIPMPAAAAPASAAGGVDVLASGVVGPFGYVVITSADAEEMITWLRDNGYRVDPGMEPYIKVYVDDAMPLLAMRLQPGRGTSDITPIKLEYASSQPMIPLRLTAIAAQPDMPVLVWVFARGRTGPLNYVDMTISDGEILFTPMGSNNYRQVVSQAADQAGGRAFVTEYAGPTWRLSSQDTTVQTLSQRYPYLTRFYTRISPNEMTEDPIFDYAPDKADVSNVHDLTALQTPFVCSDDFNTQKPIPGAGLSGPGAELQRYLERFGSSGVPRGGLLALVIVGLVGLALGGRRLTRLARPRLALPQAGARLRGALKVSAQAGRLLLLEALMIQGFHEIEHVVQVIQRYSLGIRQGSGVLGSLFDVEPVHFIYNATFLGLLALAYVGCRRPGGVPQRRGLVLGLLAVALVGQSYHFVEHTVKMTQFIQTGLNGTPGILGLVFPVVWLHFWFNTLLYIPVVAAFCLGGFAPALGRDLARLLPRAQLRRWGSLGTTLLR